MEPGAPPAEQPGGLPAEQLDGLPTEQRGDLPTEQLVAVLAHLTPEQRGAVGRVCRKWTLIAFTPEVDRADGVTLAPLGYTDRSFAWHEFAPWAAAPLVGVELGLAAWFRAEDAHAERLAAAIVGDVPEWPQTLSLDAGARFLGRLLRLTCARPGRRAVYCCRREYRRGPGDPGERGVLVYAATDRGPRWVFQTEAVFVGAVVAELVAELQALPKFKGRVADGHSVDWRLACALAEFEREPVALAAAVAARHLPR